jgi:hypothetical protein
MRQCTNSSSQLAIDHANGDGLISSSRGPKCHGRRYFDEVNVTGTKQRQQFVARIRRGVGGNDGERELPGAGRLATALDADHRAA